MNTIAENLATIQKKIETCAKNCGRDPKAIQVLAVSKRKSSDNISTAYQAGQRNFGENYATELRNKGRELDLPELRWHMIGHVQRKNVKHILPFCSLLHSLDQLELAPNADLAHK